GAEQVELDVAAGQRDGHAESGAEAAAGHRHVVGAGAQLRVVAARRVRRDGGRRAADQLRGDLDAAAAFANRVEIVAVGVGVGHAGEERAAPGLGEVLRHHGGVVVLAVGGVLASHDVYAALLIRVVQ